MESLSRLQSMESRDNGFGVVSVWLDTRFTYGSATVLSLFSPIVGVGRGYGRGGHFQGFVFHRLGASRASGNPIPLPSKASVPFGFAICATTESSSFCRASNVLVRPLSIEIQSHSLVCPEVGSESGGAPLP